MGGHSFSGRPLGVVAADDVVENIHVLKVAVIDHIDLPHHTQAFDGENRNLVLAQLIAAGALGENGHADDHTGVDFTVRFCSAVSAVTTTEYRVMFGGEIYDIIGIDHMNNKHKSIKLRCRKVRRSQ